MPRFTFRLEVPLRLARAQRTGLRKEMAIALRDRDVAEGLLEAGRAEVRLRGAELQRRTLEGIGGAELALLSGARDAAARKLPALQDRLRAADEREQEVRAQLAQATREVSVLEKLRHKAFEDWRRDLARREQAMIDDVVLVRKARAMAEGR